MNQTAISTVDQSEGRAPQTPPVKVEPRVPFAFRFMPSLTDVAFLMPIVFLLLSPEGVPGMLEGDTGWHIRTGEWILQNHAVPYRDFYSYTKPGEPWFAWEWLWDVPAALLHARGGLTAVILASLLVICFASALLFKLSFRRSGSVFAAAAVSLVAVMTSSMHWLARPHLVSFVFVIVFYWIIEDTRHRGMRRLWLLPPLTALWTNLHGGFVAGLVLLGAYVTGEFFGGFVTACATERRERFRTAGWYFAAALACLAASLVNPYGYKLHVHVLKYLNEPAILTIVGEWQSISFRSPTGPYLELFIVLALAAALHRARRRDYVPMFLVLGWMHQALVSARNIPIFVLVAAPLVAQALVEWWDAIYRTAVPLWLKKAAGRLEETATAFARIDRIPRFHAAAVIPFLLFAALCFRPNLPLRLQGTYDPAKYPVKAMAQLEPVAARVRPFIDDEWGDYAIYRLYPAGRVFIDGRFDFYGRKHTELFLDLMKVKYNWEQELQRYRVDTLLLRADASLAEAAKLSPNWQLTYDDGVALIFRRAGQRSAAGHTSFSPLPSGGNMPRLSIGAGMKVQSMQ